MAQHVIDGILYSPVNAHALRKGDLTRGVFGAYRLLNNPSPMPERGPDALRADVLDKNDEPTWVQWWRNEPVLRAVGAGVGGVA